MSEENPKTTNKGHRISITPHLSRTSDKVNAYTVWREELSAQAAEEYGSQFREIILFNRQPSFAMISEEGVTSNSEKRRIMNVNKETKAAFKKFNEAQDKIANAAINTLDTELKSFVTLNSQIVKTHWGD